MTNYVKAHGKNIYDVIPADIVCNTILIAGAEAKINKKDFEIVNIGSSGINPLTMTNFLQYGVDAVKSVRLRS